MLDITKAQTTSEEVSEIAKALVAKPTAYIVYSDVNTPLVKEGGHQLPDPNTVRITRPEFTNVKECFILKSRVRYPMHLADTNVPYDSRSK